MRSASSPLGLVLVGGARVKALEHGRALRLLGPGEACEVLLEAPHLVGQQARALLGVARADLELADALLGDARLLEARAQTLLELARAHALLLAGAARALRALEQLRAALVEAPQLGRGLGRARGRALDRGLKGLLLARAQRDLLLGRGAALAELVGAALGVR
jgi:hypothetical protein